MNNLIEEIIDDGSIVVVSKQSMNEEMETESYMFTPRFVPGMSQSQQLSDSTHKQLQDILKENNELRDSLHKNNTEMRQLLGAFRDYQDKTLQSRALHKQKIDAIWKESQQLQLEKTNMLKERKEIEDQLKLRDLEIQKLQHDMSDFQNNCSGLENDVTALKEDLKRSEVMILTMTNQLKEQESELTSLKSEKEKLFNQNEALIEQLNKQNEVHAASEQRYNAGQTELQVTKEELLKHQSQIGSLMQKIESESNQKQALLENLEKQNAVFKNETSAVHQENVELTNRLLSLDMHLSDRETSEQESRTGLELAQKQIADLLEKIVELEEEKNLSQQLKAPSRLSSGDSEDMGFSLVNKPEDASLQKKLGEEETKVKELNHLVFQQKEQIEKLEKALLLSHGPPSIEPADFAERFFEIQKMTNLKPAFSFFQEYEDRYQSLGQQLGACEERLQYLKLEGSSSVFQEGLKQEVDVLKQLLEQERHEKVAEKKILEDRIEQLTLNYRQILASWEIYESDQKTKGRQNEALNAIEKRQHQEQMDELMAQNVNLEEESQAKDGELARLKRQITMLNTETEQMPILRAQVEVYRQDFDKEREERTKVETAASQLRQEVAILQAQVSELRDELSAVHDHQRQELSFNHSGSYRQLKDDRPPSPPTIIDDFIMPRGHHSRDEDREHSSRKKRSHQSRRLSPPSSQDQGAAGSQNLFECPRCKLTYKTVADVENHLDRCLSEDSPYP